jgi:hypothetical protein
MASLGRLFGCFRLVLLLSLTDGGAMMAAGESLQLASQFTSFMGIFISGPEACVQHCFYSAR